MKCIAFLAVCPILLWAQPTSVRVEGVTPTQAIISYTAPSASACTLILSESPSLSPVVNDVNSSLFAASDSDARAAIGAGVAGRRVVVLGTRAAQASGGKMYSRALAADTAHYGSVTCGSAVSFSFRTAQIRDVAPQELPFDTSAQGNWAVPSFDWSDRTKAVVDPNSGAKIWRVTDPSELGLDQPRTFTTVLNGTGWTNLNNVLSNSTSSLATTTNTNPIFLPLLPPTNEINPAGGYADINTTINLANLQFTAHGNGDNATASNRQISVCLSIDSGQTCYSDAITITLPQTTSSTVSGPGAYPGVGFAGWSKAIPKEHLPRYWAGGASGSISASSGSLSVTSAVDGSYPRRLLGQEWPANVKMFITGSSPTCANNICTVSSVTTALTGTLSESLTISNAVGYSLNVGFRVVKATATGTLNLSAGYRVAAYGTLQQAASNACSTYTVTANVDAAGSPISPGVEGRLCLFPRFNGGPDGTSPALYFVGTRTPDFRFISPFRTPTAISGLGANDLPANAGATPSSIYFGAMPNVFYTAVPTNNSSSGCAQAVFCPTLFSMTYTGDYRAHAAWQWADSGGWFGTDSSMTWANLATGVNALSSQAAAASGYNATFWGAAGLGFLGISGNYAIFSWQPFGQDYGAWLFSFNLSTLTLASSFNTFNQVTSIGRAYGDHSHMVRDGRFLISTRPLDNGTQRTGGPYRVTPSQVWKSGSANNNTSLPWPPDSSYDNTCPAGLPAAIVARGATAGSSNCVRMTITANNVCTPGTPASGQNSLLPCPANSARTWLGSNIAVGDTFIDIGLSSPGDGEYFVVASVSGNDIWFLRDASTGYACSATVPRGGRQCINGNERLTHANGFTLQQHLPTTIIWINPADGSFTLENDWVARGHFDVDAAGGQWDWVGIAGDSQYVGRIGTVSSLGSTSGLTYFRKDGQFFNATAQLGSWAQSYIGTGPTSGNWRGVGGDWRHINSAIGSAAEYPGQTVGTAISTVTLQGGTSSVYLLSPITGSWNRQRPWMIWAGMYILSDKSSAATGNQLTDSDTWRFCYALNAGECRSGSSAGALYAVIPTLDNVGQCWASQISRRQPCIFVSDNYTAEIMQMRYLGADPDGIYQRSIGFGLERPGAQYVYSKARMENSGQSMLATLHHMDGWFSGVVRIDPGAWNQSSIVPNQYAPVILKAASAFYVEFGYSPQFYCSSRQEVCRVGASTIQATPWKYASESGSTDTATTVSIPALPGRVLYYRTVVGGVPGPLSVVAP